MIRAISLAAACVILAAAAPPTDQASSDLDSEIVPALDSIAGELKAANAPKPIEAECAEGTNLRSSDLCAQWKAADAARSASIATWVAAVAGVLTLWAAFLAARWAKRAATEARKGNELAVSVQRAWITIEAVPLFSTEDIDRGLYFRCEVVAKNVGQTLATHFNVRSTLLFQKEHEEHGPFMDRMQHLVAEWISETAVQAERILPPGGIYPGPLWKPIPAQEMVLDTLPTGAKACSPVLLSAALYRTVSAPKILQCSWAAWYISSVESNGHALSCLRLDKDFTADQLRAHRMTGLNHREIEQGPVTVAQTHSAANHPPTQPAPRTRSE